jgi:hypothetical protein
MPNFNENKFKRIVLLTPLVMLVMFGWILADTLTRTRDVTANLEVSLFRHQGNEWKVFDKVRINGVQFSAKVSDLAGGKKRVASDFVWTHRSEQGRPLVVRLLQPGDATVNLVTGRLDVDFKTLSKFGGRNLNFPVHLTTETVQTPNGSISGRRAQINSAAHSATLGFVGSETVQFPAFEGEPAEKVLAVIRGDGILVAKN